MPWIRLDTGMKRDPRLWLMADDVKRDVGAVVGYVANVLAELPEHARDGNLTDVPDALLEQWALWPGKKGAFARAFVTHLCDGRKVRAWEKHNGSALRQRDETHKRVRAYRERNGKGNAVGNALPNDDGDELRNDDCTTSTERNGTVRNGKTTPKPPAVAVRGDPEFDEFWAKYPERAGSNPRATALSAWVARRGERVPAEAMLAGEDRYIAYLRSVDKIGTPYVQQAATFLSKAKRSWEEPWPVAEQADELAAAAIAARDQQDADQAWLAERRRLAGVP